MSEHEEQVDAAEPAPAEAGERTLPITREQAGMLMEAHAALASAQRTVNLVAGAIVAGHGIRDCQILEVSGGEEPSVRVRLPG